MILRKKYGCNININIAIYTMTEINHILSGRWQLQLREVKGKRNKIVNLSNDYLFFLSNYVNNTSIHNFTVTPSTFK